MDIAFVATTKGVEANTPFHEGNKRWGDFKGVAIGPETYLGTDGKPVVSGRKWLMDRTSLAEKILAAWTKNGENYAV